MNRHIPVLLSELLEILNPIEGEDFADLTAGYGGHSEALLEKVGDKGSGYLFDKDSEAVKYLRHKFETNKNINIYQTDFADIDWDTDIPQVDIIIADIGVSSPQLDDTERGFSFKSDARLDMRMNQQQELDAYTVINTYSEKDLADIFYRYGEEHSSRRIAKAIANARKKAPIQSTVELADLIAGSTHNKTGKIHPATKCFQAIRIEVNQELDALEKLLQSAPKHLNAGGRLAIISFHSLEDRMVKQAFNKLCKPEKDEFGQNVSKPEYKSVTKKPIKGSEYDKSNPRARSAKLRVVEKIN
ncbi:MAG: Ribosomal small subunit methyltransferase [Patescibacteria group bacterium]|jgi:16S rRNA (cytosine1402-N4)-methyltransferase|nr:Ribosomal small subunit methyltransferase [Patescibacteria group bacterium]